MWLRQRALFVHPIPRSKYACHCHSTIDHFQGSPGEGKQAGNLVHTILQTHMKLTLKIEHISKENCPKITFEGQGILVQQVYLKVSISFQSFLQEHISPSATLAQNSSRDTRSSTQSLGSIKARWPTAFNCRMTIPRTPLPTYGLLNPGLISLLRSHLKAPPHTHTHFPSQISFSSQVTCWHLGMLPSFSLWHEEKIALKGTFL